MEKYLYNLYRPEIRELKKLSKQKLIEKVIELENDIQNLRYELAGKDI